jgi:hypothetical protein
MLKKSLFPVMALLLLVWAVGCSDNPVDTVGDTAGTTSDFGGYTTEPEQPGFGDNDLIAAEADEVEVDDEILMSPGVQEIVGDVNSGMFRFRAVWGQIPGDSTINEVTDWTGSLTISRGALVVRRLIRFELNQDYYLPRTDRRLVEWISFTTVHNDGMAFDIYVPAEEPVVDTSFTVGDNNDTTWIYEVQPVEPVAVTFTTPQYTRTFSLAEIAALDELVELDDGTELSFQGVQYFRQACPRGILAGTWGWDDEGAQVFKGLWFSPLGHVVGYLNGTYGVDENQQNVFYGKWIDRSGAFEGLLAGTWGYRPHTSANDIAHRRAAGWFAGMIYDAGEVEIGALAGNFGTSPTLIGGWFGGRWKLACASDSTDGNGVLEDGINSARIR